MISRAILFPQRYWFNSICITSFNYFLDKLGGSREWEGGIPTGTTKHVTNLDLEPFLYLGNVSSGNPRMPLHLHWTSLHKTSLKKRSLKRKSWDLLSRKDLFYRGVLYHQQRAQLQTHSYKGRKEPFIWSELLHNTGHRISPTNSYIKPTTSVWARQCFLYALH